jgi:hypothetical protein
VKTNKIAIGVAFGVFILALCFNAEEIHKGLKSVPKSATQTIPYASSIASPMATSTTGKGAVTGAATSTPVKSMSGKIASVNSAWSMKSKVSGWSVKSKASPKKEPSFLPEESIL